MANSNIASIGRFSSQMLTYFGTQRTVKLSGGAPVNTFKYATGPTTYPTPGSYSQADLGGGVSGSFQSSSFDATKCHFMSRGASIVYAEAMAALTIDMASMLGVTPQSLLEQADFTGNLAFSENAYRAFNVLRDPGNQVGTVTSVDNRYSPQARQIRS